MANRIDDRDLDGDKLNAPRESQSSATSFSITTNGLATQAVAEDINEELNLPSFSESETAGNVFQDDDRGQHVENVKSGGSQVFEWRITFIWKR